MEITYAKLQNASEALEYLLTTRLDISVTLPLRRLAKAVKEEMSHFEAERNILLEKYGEHNEDGSLKVNEQRNIPIQPEHVPAFTEAFTKLLEQKADVPANVIDLYKLEGIKISAVELYHLDPFIKEIKEV
jgi:hypothetical protein